MPPRRRRSVPIANEDRLVVPDMLGTTIKLSFLEGPAPWRQRTTASGAGTVTFRAVSAVLCTRTCGETSRDAHGGQQRAPRVAPRRQRCVLEAALGSDGYPIRPKRQSSRLAAWKLSGQPPEP